MLKTLRNSLPTSAASLAGMITVLAVSMPLLWYYFSEGHPDRWYVAGLLLTFIVLSQVVEHGYLPQTRWAAYLYLAVQTVIVTALVLIEPYQFLSVILFFVLSAEAPTLLPGRQWWVWIAIFGLATTWTLFGRGDTSNLIVLPVYFAAFIFFAAFSQQTMEAQEAREESQRLLDELQVAHRQLQSLAAQAEELAVSEERNRLAREMHDTLGHRLTVAAVQLQAVERLIPTDADRSVKMTGTVREQIRQALTELRRTVATLRAPLETDLALLPALRRLAEEFDNASNTTVHLMLPNELPDLPPAHRLALYRAAQEGLTNVQKHADARDVWLQLDQRDSTLTLTVRDNGVGLMANNEKYPAFGLRGLQERAALVGGDLDIEAQASGGTLLQLSVLVQENPND
ncbi:MAG: sensor histidine kinase [Chloroflexota bacterium]|nr:sensor histidine kinase [Chloroflexota bacterium]